MKNRFFDTTSLTEFNPRNVCFAESDADDSVPAGGGAPAPESAEEELVLDDDQPAAGAEGVEDDDTDELEIGPEKFKVPKKVKEAWNGVQKSTQTDKEALAAERKAVEERGKRYEENMRIASTYVKEIGKIQAIDEQIAEYEKLTPADWMAWAKQDDKAAAQAQLGYNALVAEKAKLLRSVQDKEQSIKTQREKEHAEFVAKSERELAAKIKDWSPQKRDALFKVANDYGFSKEDLMPIAHDARMYAVLEDASKYREAKARAKKVAEEAKAAAAASSGAPEPVRRARGNTGATTSLGDTVSMETFAKNFNRQRSVHFQNRPK